MDRTSVPKHAPINNPDQHWKCQQLDDCCTPVLGSTPETERQRTSKETPSKNHRRQWAIYLTHMRRDGWNEETQRDKEQRQLRYPQCNCLCVLHVIPFVAVEVCHGSQQPKTFASPLGKPTDARSLSRLVRFPLQWM